jgi:hypothetical protein
MNENDKQGLFAERMVKSLLKKISFDFPGAYFEIVGADAEQDVNRKIDFMLIKKNHTRDVAVEAKQVQGIQFTINTHPDRIKRKREQIAKSKNNENLQDNNDHVQDIVLVTASIDDVKEKYNRWSRYKNSGGPDEYWTPEIKIKILENVLKDFLDQQSIDNITEFIRAKENSGTSFKY